MQPNLHSFETRKVIRERRLRTIGEHALYAFFVGVACYALIDWFGFMPGVIDAIGG